MVSKALVGIGVIAFLAGGVFLLHGERTIALIPQSIVLSTPITSSSLAAVAPAGTGPASSSAPAGAMSATDPNAGDIPDQPQLANPPAVVKGIYITGWSAGSAKKLSSLISLIDRTELNAAVVDIKDYSGYVSYHTSVPEVKAAGAEREIRIARPNAVIKALHDKGIYVIGRITTFQDPILAKAHPEWAMKDKATGGVWLDQKGIAWIDPAEKGVWEYVASLAKDAFRRGFDEVNFDYVRFASDGNLSKIDFPAWDMKTPRHVIIKNFFTYLRGALPGVRISADLFGLTAVNHDDLGIGQVIEDAYPNFDYVSPMTYPSHYASGFLGYKNPGAYPYEVMKYSIDMARNRLTTLESQFARAAASSSQAALVATAAVASPPPLAKLRPWIQDFNLGATYTAAMVRKQITAIDDAMRIASSTDMSPAFGGWIIWSPSNNYTEGALQSS